MQMPTAAYIMVSQNAHSVCVIFVYSVNFLIECGNFRWQL